MRHRLANKKMSFSIAVLALMIMVAAMTATATVAVTANNTSQNQISAIQLKSNIPVQDVTTATIESATVTAMMMTTAKMTITGLVAVNVNTQNLTEKTFMAAISAQRSSLKLTTAIDQIPATVNSATTVANAWLGNSTVNTWTSILLNKKAANVATTKETLSAAPVAIAVNAAT